MVICVPMPPFHHHIPLNKKIKTDSVTDLLSFVSNIGLDDVVFLVAWGEVSSMLFFDELNISSEIETNFSDLGGSWKTFSNLLPEARRCSDKPLFYQVSH